MHTTDSPSLQVRGPADLLAAVPYLLGFHPQESLVIIGLADNRVVVTARLDLTDVTHLTGSRLLAATLAAIQRGDATSVLGAVFTDTSCGSTWPAGCPARTARRRCSSPPGVPTATATAPWPTSPPTSDAGSSAADLLLAALLSGIDPASSPSSAQPFPRKEVTTRSPTSPHQADGPLKAHGSAGTPSPRPTGRGLRPSPHETATRTTRTNSLPTVPVGGLPTVQEDNSSDDHAPLYQRLHRRRRRRRRRPAPPSQHQPPPAR
ncbi:MAG: DUF4192 family protein [Actinomycetota bacterium]|nr:DUF4192 family protein [Actinomycetota bacterium]